MGTNNRKGIALVEVLVSIVIATIVLSAATTVLPRIFTQLKSGVGVEKVQDYIKIITDFRNADMDSVVSNNLFELKSNGETVLYINESDGLYRSHGDIRQKMHFDKLTIDRQLGGNGNEWKTRGEPAKILYYNWWRLNMHKGEIITSGIIKGK